MRTYLLGLVLLAACGGGSHSGPDASGPPDDGSVGTGATCGGVTHAVCGATDYCDYADNGCGIGDRTGTCKPRPSKCPLVLARPTCGCDGRIYSGDCVTYMSGNDLDAHGACDVPQGRFICGYVQCGLATEYCQRAPRTGMADTYACVGLPSGCTIGSPSCACLSGETCGKTCAGNATVGLTLICPAVR